MNAEEFIRRRPVYLLLDTSSSMRGAPIQAVQQGVHMIHNELLNNPHTLETVYLSVITFASAAQQVVRLCSVEEFKPPTLVADGNTALGAALTLLDQVIDIELLVNSETRKGDYRPLIFLLTDGAPTDSWQVPAARLQDRAGIKIGTLVGIGCGANAQMETLRQITSNVSRVTDVSPDSLHQFFKWVSASIQRTSQGRGPSVKDGSLDALPLPSVMNWVSKD